MSTQPPLIINGACKYCGNSLAGKRRGTHYCSQSCRYAAKNHRHDMKTERRQADPIFYTHKPIVITPAQAERFDAAWKRAHGRRKYRDHKKGV